MTVDTVRRRSCKRQSATSARWSSSALLLGLSTNPPCPLPKTNARSWRGCASRIASASGRERDVERFRVFCPFARQRDHRTVESRLSYHLSPPISSRRAAGQKQQPDDGGVLVAAGGRRPDRSQLVAGQNALARAALLMFRFVLATAIGIDPAPRRIAQAKNVVKIGAQPIGRKRSSRRSPISASKPRDGAPIDLGERLKSMQWLRLGPAGDARLPA